jgi:hypothetical protein
MKPQLILCCLLLLVVVGFAQKKAPTQGVKGVVLWKAGNFMPSPDTKSPLPKGMPIVREIWIYELTNQNQTEVSEEATFYKKINAKLIKKVKSGKDGRFVVSLPVGQYSVFAKEEKGFYANLFDDAMNLNPLTINKKKWTRIEVVIDYEAVY